MEFPTPIGGTVLPSDFIPSVLFAVLYGALLPLVVFRLVDKRSRSIVLISTSIFAVERIVIYSLRAAQARSDSLRVSSGLITYLQVSFAMGFITIANDQVNTLRCLLVNTTFSCDMYEQSPPSRDAPLNARNHRKVDYQGFFGGWLRERFTGQPNDGDPDYPKRRFWFRRAQEIGSLLFIAAIVPSIVAHQKFGQLINDQSSAASVFRLRYAGTAVALFFTLIIAGATMWAYMKLPRVRTKSVVVLLSVCTLVSIIAIYRFSVMYNTTNSLFSVGHNSLNSAGAKACFYVFHVVPEWLATLLLFSTNVRQVFGTGPFGDWRKADETEKERNKRLERQKKAARKKEKAMLDEKAKVVLE
ncbi:hypothetical protein JOM56_015027 [Amanita muscaria]